MNITVSDIIGLIGGAVIIYKAITLTPIEGRVSEASILETYEKTINQAVDRGLKLSDRIATLEEDNKRILRERDERDEKINDLLKKVAEQQITIERLEHQILSYNKTPVTKMEPIDKQ